MLVYYSDSIHLSGAAAAARPLYDILDMLEPWWLQSTNKTEGWPVKFSAPGAKLSQEANVPTRNSSLCWQFGEILAQEPFVPLNVNRASATIHSRGLTGIWLHRNVHWPPLLPWICLLWFLQGLSCRPTEGPHWRCWKRPTLFYLPAEFAMAWQKSVGIPGTSFHLSVKYVHFIKQNLAASCQLQRRYALRTAILWMFHDDLVNHLNLTGN